MHHWTAALLLLLPGLVAGRFQVDDDAYTTGTDTVHLKVLRNVDSGESAAIVWDMGGRVDVLQLRTSGTAHAAWSLFLLEVHLCLPFNGRGRWSSGRRA
jgi:hypothetical protein